MAWHRDKTRKLTGDLCVGQGFVTVDTASRLLGVPIPGTPEGLVPVMNSRQKKVPKSGLVMITLKPSGLGHSVLATAAARGEALPVLGRMTLIPGNGGKILSANRTLFVAGRR